MSVKLTPRKKLFVETAAEMYGNGAVVSKHQIREAAKKAGVPSPTWFKKEAFRVGHGEYKLPDLDIPVVASTLNTASAISISKLLAVVKASISNSIQSTSWAASIAGFSS